MIEELTLIQAKSKVEHIDNQIEYYLNKKEFEISKMMPKTPQITDEKVDGGKRVDKYANYVINTVEIDNILNGLYADKLLYEDFIEKELIRLNKYSEIEQLIIFYKENSKEKYTWQQIATRVNYSVSQCRRIYRKWAKKRDV